MKSFIKAAVLFAALTAVFTFASCETETGSDNPVIYTVTFDGNGSEPVFYTMLSVKSGDFLPIPEFIPVKRRHYSP